MLSGPFLSGRINPATNLEAKIALTRPVRDPTMVASGPVIPVVATARAAAAPVTASRRTGNRVDHLTASHRTGNRVDHLMASHRTGNRVDHLMASHRTGNRVDHLTASHRTGNRGIPAIPVADHLAEAAAGQRIESPRTGSGVAGPAGHIRKRIIEADPFDGTKT